MGFSWTPITQYVTEVAAVHVNQVKTNVDSVYTDLALPTYSWAYLPVNVGDEIQHEDFKELRDAIDYADEQNYCRSHNSPYCSSDKAAHDSAVDNDDHGSYLNDDHSTYLNDDNGVEKTWHYSTVDNGYLLTDYTVHCTNHRAWHCVSYLGADKRAVDAAVDTTVKNSYNVSFYSGGYNNDYHSSN